MLFYATFHYLQNCIHSHVIRMHQVEVCLSVTICPPPPSFWVCSCSSILTLPNCLPVLLQLPFHTTFSGVVASNKPNIFPLCNESLNNKWSTTWSTRQLAPSTNERHIPYFDGGVSEYSFSHATVCWTALYRFTNRGRNISAMSKSGRLVFVVFISLISEMDL